MTSVPPPSPAAREFVLALEGSRSGALTLGPEGASIMDDRALREPLRLALGTLRLGLVEPGPARPGRDAGRFFVLKRLSASTVLPRSRGIEGWLWTSTGGSALTVLGDEQDAPNAALLFTTPLGEDAVACFEPAAAAEIAARSPLGAPAVHGLLFRVADTRLAEETFRRFGLLRPLTDREVPPTLRRSLPGDRPARVRPGELKDPRAATSVAPPGFG